MNRDTMWPTIVGFALLMAALYCLVDMLFELYASIEFERLLRYPRRW